MVKLSSFHFLRNGEELAAVPDGKCLINTLNAYSFNMVQHDPAFEAALRGGAAHQFAMGLHEVFEKLWNSTAHFLAPSIS